MDEVEEICDNVTIMRRGTVAFHGTIADLRAMAPDPGHVLRTTDDDRAVEVAAAHSGVRVEPDRVDGGLIATGPQHAVTSYVADLVRGDVGLLAFTPTRTPLEALFFMLTDPDGVATSPEAVTA
jgi:ABC-2 type transport system ATP-binding protein